jgi:hypothetical protein
MTLVEALVYSRGRLSGSPDRVGNDTVAQERGEKGGAKLTIHGNSTDDILTQVLL